MRWIPVIVGLAMASACGTFQPYAPAPRPIPHAATPAAAPAPTPSPTAAAQPAQANVRVGGEVTAIDGGNITVRGADGASSTFALAPDAWIIKTRPIQASDIHPGDFVATANTNNADGTGTSTELRVFPPGMRLGEGSYPMQEPNTTMTNATVAHVVTVDGGRQLTVTYGANPDTNSSAGTRTITLPENVQVVQWYRAQVSDVHVGVRVRGRAHAGASGGVVADFVLVDDAAH